MNTEDLIEWVNAKDEPWFAVVEGRKSWLSDPFHSGVLVRQGQLDLTGTYAAMSKGEVEVVLAGIWVERIDGMPELLADHYWPVFTTTSHVLNGPVTVWVHHNRPDLLPARL